MAEKIRGLRWSSTLLVVRTLGLLFALTAAASFASAQSIDRAKQLFEDARYAEAKTELLALQKANDRNAAAAYYLGTTASRSRSIRKARPHNRRWTR